MKVLAPFAPNLSPLHYLVSEFWFFLLQRGVQREKVAPSDFLCALFSSPLPFSLLFFSSSRCFPSQFSVRCGLCEKAFSTLSHCLLSPICFYSHFIVLLWMKTKLLYIQHGCFQSCRIFASLFYLHTVCLLFLSPVSVPSFSAVRCFSFPFQHCLLLTKEHNHGVFYHTGGTGATFFA